jgi:hypothetical protein
LFATTEGTQSSILDSLEKGEKEVLFKEEDIDKLLDREALLKQEEKRDTPAQAAFSFAKVWTLDEDREVDSSKEANDSDELEFWKQILPETEIVVPEFEERGGRYLRKRRKIDLAGDTVEDDHDQSYEPPEDHSTDEEASQGAIEEENKSLALPPRGFFPESKPLSKPNFEGGLMPFIPRTVPSIPYAPPFKSILSSHVLPPTRPSSVFPATGPPRHNGTVPSSIASSFPFTVPLPGFSSGSKTLFNQSSATTSSSTAPIVTPLLSSKPVASNSGLLSLPESFKDTVLTQSITKQTVNSVPPFPHKVPAEAIKAPPKRKMSQQTVLDWGKKNRPTTPTPRLNCFICQILPYHGIHACQKAKDKEWLRSILKQWTIAPPNDSSLKEKILVIRRLLSSILDAEAKNNILPEVKVSSHSSVFVGQEWLPRQRNEPKEKESVPIIIVDSNKDKHVNLSHDKEVNMKKDDQLNSNKDKAIDLTEDKEVNLNKDNQVNLSNEKGVNLNEDNEVSKEPPLSLPAISQDSTTTISKKSTSTVIKSKLGDQEDASLIDEPSSASEASSVKDNSPVIELSDLPQKTALISKSTEWPPIQKPRSKFNNRKTRID